MASEELERDIISKRIKSGLLAPRARGGKKEEDLQKKRQSRNGYKNVCEQGLYD
ncbi:hypothetical protein JCM21714_2251 [Gracilibacillus boraciitolerans JCM 21714]|uniref:Resolvase/invertase-type recombinase catalytic domain-containing protein n=1 Tax=Gracilibacillus boraciitolerans JCM 21714 TaxID=1298598 RepID=W4VJ06_9BACI|nr:hypothetical protein JCM21714_2251 [Gracilibacillus boraciitolerans JCM 21714]